MHKYIDKSSEQNGRSAVYREDTDAGNMAPHSGYPQEHTQAGGPACSITYVDRYLSIGSRTSLKCRLMLAPAPAPELLPLVCRHLQ